MAPSDDLTVGEVLSLLQEDFPEATLGRLREFEDLGLISPELSPSGHRRYPADTLERMRWALTKMRDGFDPADLTDDSSESSDLAPSDPRPSGSAAVVRKKSGGDSVAEPTLFDDAERQDQASPMDDHTAVQPLPTLAGGRQRAATPAAPKPPDRAASKPAAAESTSTHQAVESTAKPSQRAPRRQPEPPVSHRPEPATPPPAAGEALKRVAKPHSERPAKPSKPTTAPPKPVQPVAPVQPEPSSTTPSPSSVEEERKARIEAVTALQESPQVEPAARPRPSRTRDLPSATQAAELLARTDFLTEVNIDETTLGEMERFGVISPVTIGGTSSYDQSAVRVGHIIANLLKQGYEARHLRMFRMSAEREVDLLRQMSLPLLKQRNPVGREQARERLQRAADLGGELRAALVAEGIAEVVDHSGAADADS